MCTIMVNSGSREDNRIADARARSVRGARSSSGDQASGVGERREVVRQSHSSACGEVRVQRVRA